MNFFWTLNRSLHDYKSLTKSLKEVKVSDLFKFQWRISDCSLSLVIDKGRATLLEIGENGS